MWNREVQDCLDDLRQVTWARFLQNHLSDVECSVLGMHRLRRGCEQSAVPIDCICRHSTSDQNVNSPDTKHLVGNIPLGCFYFPVTEMWKIINWSSNSGSYGTNFNAKCYGNKIKTHSLLHPNVYWKWMLFESPSKISVKKKKIRNDLTPFPEDTAPDLCSQLHMQSSKVFCNIYLLCLLAHPRQMLSVETQSLQLWPGS